MIATILGWFMLICLGPFALIIGVLLLALMFLIFIHVFLATIFLGAEGILWLIKTIWRIP